MHFHRKRNAIFILALSMVMVFGPISYGHTETIYLKNEKGSDTMILRTKPSTTKSEPRPRREYSDEEVRKMVPSSIQLESYGRPYLPNQRPPHHSKPPHKRPPYRSYDSNSNKSD